MTADRLARHYPSLQPDERLALMLAAAARGDDVEHERLVAAAPRVTLAPVDPADVRADDIVLVAWKGGFLLHLVREVADARLLIGNNLGKVNGWVAAAAVEGTVVAVED